MTTRRQKLLFLYLADSALDSPTVAWSIYDGTGQETPPPEVDSPAPYRSVLDAMKDGWRVIQIPRLQMKYGHELETDYLEFEFVLEQLVEV